jgi:hypothetical protein
MGEDLELQQLGQNVAKKLTYDEESCHAGDQGE